MARAEWTRGFFWACPFILSKLAEECTPSAGRTLDFQNVVLKLRAKDKQEGTVNSSVPLSPIAEFAYVGYIRAPFEPGFT